MPSAYHFPGWGLCLPEQPTGSGNASASSGPSQVMRVNRAVQGALPTTLGTRQSTPEARMQETRQLSSWRDQGKAAGLRAHCQGPLGLRHESGICVSLARPCEDAMWELSPVRGRGCPCRRGSRCRGPVGSREAEVAGAGGAGGGPHDRM